MSIEFLSPGILLTCDVDGCQEEMEWTEWTEFIDAISEAKEAGWKMKKIEDKWQHTCPDCVERKHD